MNHVRFTDEDGAEHVCDLSRLWMEKSDRKHWVNGHLVSPQTYGAILSVLQPIIIQDGLGVIDD